jgi:tetratricopeptide (TPR) repeat protein
LRRAQNNRAGLLVELGAALSERGEFEEAKRVLASTADVAASEGDDRLVWRARLEDASARALRGPVEAIDEVADQIREAIEFLTGVDDAAGLAHAWRVLSQMHLLEGRGEQSYEAAQHAVDYARTARDEPELARAITHVNTAMFFGPTPVSEAIDRAERPLATFGTNQTIEGTALSSLCLYLGMATRFDEARAAGESAKANAEDLGQRHRLAVRCANCAAVELWAGNLEAAEAEIRRSWDLVAEMGMDLGPTGIELAEVLHRMARDEEALSILDTYPISETEPTGFATWQITRATVIARLGRVAEAAELTESALERADRTDFLNLRADGRLAAGEVLSIAGRPAEAVALTEDAVRLYKQKGNAAEEAKARGQLKELLATTG